MDHFIPTQLRFPARAGFTIRAEFDGGAMSSDFGAVLLRGIDLQIGLIPRLVSAIHDQRHASYMDPPWPICSASGFSRRPAAMPMETTPTRCAEIRCSSERSVVPRWTREMTWPPAPRSPAWRTVSRAKTSPAWPAVSSRPSSPATPMRRP